MFDKLQFVAPVAPKPGGYGVCLHSGQIFPDASRSPEGTAAKRRQTEVCRTSV